MTQRTSLAVILAVVVAGAACDRTPNVDQVPVGSTVQITRSDGGVVTGTLTDKSAQQVRISTASGVRELPRAAIADVQIVDAKTPVTLPKIAKFRDFTVPAGTTLAVRLSTPLSSATSRVEDPVEGELTEPIRVGDTSVWPAGSLVHGVVSEAQPSAKVKGLASLALAFREIAPAGRDDHYDLQAQWTRQAQSTKAEDAKKIGIGAGAGAAVGAIIGGGKGAAIGTAIGGGGGTAVVLSTSGKEVTLDRGAIVTVTLAKSVDVRVPIAAPVAPSGH